MHIIFNKKTTHIILLMLSTYAIFVVLFWDILKGKVFNLGWISLFLLILFSFLLIVILVQIKRYKYRLSDKNIIVVLLITIVFSGIIQHTIHLSRSVDFTKKKFTNPLYEKFIEIGKKYNIDLIFTANTWIQRGPNSYKYNTLFQKDKKSVDVLFIGDSSMAWGVIPEVIEQMTNKHIAIYAYESNPLTSKTAILFNKISEYYLKEDGVVIFSFSNWLLNQDTNSIRISQKAYKDMITWTDIDFFKSKKIDKKNYFNSYLSYTSFQDKYNYLSEYLKIKFYMYLKSPKLYTNYLEPLINSKLSKNKFKNKDKGTSYIRWNLNTITRYNIEYYQHPKSIYSNAPYVSKYRDVNSEKNAIAASHVYGRKKVFMIPLYSKEEDYIRSRTIYNTYFKKLNFILADLGKIHPKDRGYPMSNGAHMANEGGLMKSILISKWLNSHP